MSCLKLLNLRHDMFYVSKPGLQCYWKGVGMSAFQKIATDGGGYPTFIHGAEIEKCIFAQRIKII